MTTRLAALLAVLLLSLTLAACGGDDAEESDATPAAAAETAEPAAPGCESAKAAAPKEQKDRSAPKLRLSASKSYVARVDTSCGEFEITLDAKRAPKTGGAFVTLAKEGFYDGLTFHRIVPGFVIQGGDPAGNGTGGPGFSVVEAPPKDLQYTRGVVAMAKTGAEKAGTSGSQFFVVTGEDAGLPADYALLGEVTKGQEVVDTIGTATTDPATEQPTEPIVIRSIEIVES